MSTVRRILLLQGHPDPERTHLGHALGDAYLEGARAAGHEVEVVHLSELDFPLLRSAAEFERGEPPPVIADVQQALLAADHVVLVMPLWLGDMPALVKAFLEQLLRPAFVRGTESFGNRPGGSRLRGRSVRLIITMGMPVPIYRLWFGAAAVRNLRRGVFGFVGLRPVRSTLIGLAGGSDARRAGWLKRVAALGRRGV